MNSVGTVSGGANEFSNPNKMYASLLLGVRLLDQRDFGILAQALDIRDGKEVVDSLASMFQVEAGVLERHR